MFLCALLHVRKSGEVWCEGARVFMNPMSRHFNPRNAQRCLNFAVYFTPQYGDSFIEVGVWERCDAGPTLGHAAVEGVSDVVAERQLALSLLCALQQGLSVHHHALPVL